MALATSLKIAVAFAAELGLSVYTLDFKQACVQTFAENHYLLAELPGLPEKMRTGEFGYGEFRDSEGHSRKVGHLNKALCGLCDSPRLWQRFPIWFLTDEVDGRVPVSDRKVSKWFWEEGSSSQPSTSAMFPSPRRLQRFTWGFFSGPGTDLGLRLSRNPPLSFTDATSASAISAEPSPPTTKTSRGLCS